MIFVRIPINGSLTITRSRRLDFCAVCKQPTWDESITCSWCKDWYERDGLGRCCECNELVPFEEIHICSFCRKEYCDDCDELHWEEPEHNAWLND